MPLPPGIPWRHTVGQATGHQNGHQGTPRVRWLASPAPWGPSTGCPGPRPVEPFLGLAPYALPYTLRPWPAAPVHTLLSLTPRNPNGSHPATWCRQACTHFRSSAGPWERVPPRSLFTYKLVRVCVCMGPWTQGPQVPSCRRTSLHARTGRLLRRSVGCVVGVHGDCTPLLAPLGNGSPFSSRAEPWYRSRTSPARRTSGPW